MKMKAHMSYGQTNMWNLLGLLLIFALIANNKAENRTFSINYDEDSFWMDGEPFHYVSGSLHYFRSPHETWRERLRTLRSAGLNAVSTYVEWSFHEPEKGVYRWTGDHDLVKFIEIAQEEDLYVILRPGPYICAERDLGGYPYWLLNLYPNIKLRTSDADHKTEVAIWYTELMSRIQPLLYGNGGPIITVQVENEFGYFSICDHEYMAWLAELTDFWVKDAAVLFTTDGAHEGALTCGSTPGVYATVDFGTGQDVSESWQNMREFSPRGPLVNSEFYPGWITYWGGEAARVPEEVVTRSLDLMLKDGANVNFYVFHGGTNFEYSAGANSDPYIPDVTSYDYDAPMTEAGDPTSKYFAIRDVVLQYLPEPPYPPPEVKPKWSHGAPLNMEPALSLMSSVGRNLLGRPTRMFERPPTLEALGQRSGLTLYETQFSGSKGDLALLTLEDLRDRALVYLDWHFIGALSRSDNIYSLPILIDQFNFVQILVENQGRQNSGVNDFKGIVGNVTLGSTQLLNWDVTSFPLESVDGLTPAIDELDVPSEGSLTGGPVLYTAKFHVPEGEVLDTYLDVTGWSKGLAWVNGRHLGRYWPVEGPQVTLYTPAAYLKPYPEENFIVLLELQRAADNQTISFIDYTIGI